MCGAMRSSTSAASLPATRIPAISASFLIVIVILELSHRPSRIAGFHGATRPARRAPHPPPTSLRVTTEPQHLARFEGANALPGFRAQALLGRLQGAVARIAAV